MNCECSIDIFKASEYGCLICVKKFNRNILIYNDDGFYPIHIASLYGNIEVVRFFLEYGVNIDLPQKISKKNLYHKFTPLHIAIMEGHTKLVKFLLGNGANVNIPICVGRDGEEKSIFSLDIKLKIRLIIKKFEDDLDLEYKTPDI